MQIFSNFDNSSERLKEIRSNTGYGNFIRDFAFSLLTERNDITRAVKSMEKGMMSRVVSKWAEPSNIIGSSTGVSADLSLEQTKKAYEIDIYDSSSEFSTNEFGDLRTFDIDENDKILEKLNNSQDSTEKTRTDNTDKFETDNPLQETRRLVEKLALVEPVIDGRFKTTNEELNLAA
jgi:hypothetical protein